MKKLIVLIFLAACGSSSENSFFDDFGTNKITFTRCDQNGASLIFDSTIEYVDGNYFFDFQSLTKTLELERMEPLNNTLGDVWYVDRFEDVSVVLNHSNKPVLYYQSYTCYE